MRVRARVRVRVRVRVIELHGTTARGPTASVSAGLTRDDSAPLLAVLDRLLCLLFRLRLLPGALECGHGQHLG